MAYKTGTSVVVAAFPQCDRCENAAKYDARVPGDGRWAYLCPYHFRTYRCQLGIGRGQKLILREERTDGKGR